jgi:hypothetical protein
LNSSSDRRVLDEEDPDPNQTARDRQSQYKRPGYDPLEAQAVRSMTRSFAAMSSGVRACLFQPGRNVWPLITFNSVHSVTFNRNAHQGPARPAFQLEAQHDHFTILSDVSRHTEQSKIRNAFLQARRPHYKMIVLLLSGRESGDN